MKNLDKSKDIYQNLSETQEKIVKAMDLVHENLIKFKKEKITL